MKNLDLLPKTVVSLITARNKAILELKNIVTAAKIIEKTLNQIESETSQQYDLQKLKNSEPMRAQIDSEMWHKVFDDLNIYSAMDDPEAKQLNTWLYGEKPPHFTETNIRAVFEYFSTESEIDIFEQALVKIFGRMIQGDKYQSKAKYTLGKSFNIPAIAINSTSQRISLDAKEKISVMDKAVKRLVMKPFIENSLVKGINEALENKVDYEDSYYRISPLSKGTLEIVLKDDTLVNSVNGIISKWCSCGQNIAFRETISRVSSVIE
jgi:hypothetical protein